MKVLLVLVVLVFRVSFATDCNGIFLSPQGNDTSGDGSQEYPFLSFRRALEHFHQKGIGTATLCLLPGTYHDIPQEGYSIGPFDSITVLPANKTKPTLLEQVHYILSNTTNFELSHFDMNGVLLSTFNTNVHVHDMHSNSEGAILSVCPQSSSGSHSLKVEMVYGMDFNVSSAEESPALSTISIDNSILHKINIDDCETATITNSLLHSYVNVASFSSVSITNCTAAHLILSDNVQAFISLFSLSDNYDYIVNVQSNHFINNTIYYKRQSNLIYVNVDSYTLNFESNYFSCNYGIYTDEHDSYLLPLLPDNTFLRYVTANIVNNVVDQTCPIVCPIGLGPTYQGLACARCPINTISPDGKGCDPCPPGTSNPFRELRCSQCPEGEYNPSPNSTCHTCQTGTPNQNSTDCVPCHINFYAVHGYCKPCSKLDYLDHKECPQCTFFQEPPTCTQFSTDAKIMIGGVSGGVLMIIAFGIFCAHLRRRKDQYLMLN